MMKNVLLILFCLLLALSCDLLPTAEESGSSGIRVLILAEVNQGASADSISFSLAPEDGSSEAKTETLLTNGNYLEGKVEFNGLAAGTYTITTVVDGEAITAVSDISELITTSGSLYTMRIKVDDRRNFTTNILTPDGYNPGVSIEVFDVTLFQQVSDLFDDDSFHLASAYGEFTNMDSFYVRFPDGKRIGSFAAEDYRNNIWGGLFTDTNILIVQRFRAEISGDYILAVNDFNGATATRSDSENISLPDTVNPEITLGSPLSITSAARTISWSYNSESIAQIKDAFLAVYNMNILVAGYYIPGNTVSFDIPSTLGTGTYSVVMLALDEDIDAQYVTKVLLSDMSSFQGPDNIALDFTFHNLSAGDDRRNFTVIRYADTVLDVTP